MSTPFYDLASLVVVPSGYKASKVYAQKPLTTDGQLTFSRASTATRVNSAGLIETVSSNVPRLDYQGSTCPKLQLEPQRSNVCTYSSAFDDASWLKFNGSATANAAVSPDGTTNADKEVPNTSNDIHGIIKNVGSFGAGAYTASAFLKAGGYNFGYLRFTTDTDAKRYVIVLNLTTGVVTATNSFGSPVSPSYKIDNYGNGWFRLSVTLTHGSGDLAIMAGAAPSGTPTFAASIPSYAGDGTSGVFLYGAQVEAGAYATSYIPTTSAAVTRLADACYKSGISSLLGQSQGTVLVDFNYTNPPSDENGRIFNIWGGATVDDYVIFAFLNQSGQLGIVSGISNSFTTVLAASSSTALSVGRKKIAITYNAGAYKVYINGSSFATASGSAPNNFSVFEVGNVQGGTRCLANPVNQALVFKTALTNAQLAELTAL